MGRCQRGAAFSGLGGGDCSISVPGQSCAAAVGESEKRPWQCGCRANASPRSTPTGRVVPGSGRDRGSLHTPATTRNCPPTFGSCLPSSISRGRQVLSNYGSSGPARRMKRRTGPFGLPPYISNRALWRGGCSAPRPFTHESNILAWAICSAKDGGGRSSIKRVDSGETSGNPKPASVSAEVCGEEISGFIAGVTAED